jgi:hypothetical protein
VTSGLVRMLSKPPFDASNARRAFNAFADATNSSPPALKQQDLLPSEKLLCGVWY